MSAFVEAASESRARTGPPANLGPTYNSVSLELWTAIQAAISGAQSPQDALSQAQEQASQ
jgi:multiple sugar transport system substrate-binding protein